MHTLTDRGEYRVATTENDEGYGINEVHYDEFDPANKGSMIQPADQDDSNNGQNGSFLPDLRIEDLSVANEPQSQKFIRRQIQELTSQAPKHHTPLKPVVQMNQKRAYEIAQSQNSSKVFERLYKMKSHQDQLKGARTYE